MSSISSKIQNAVTSVTSNVKSVASAGTAEALVTSSTPIDSVTIKANASNTGTIYVGGSGVSSANGYQLAAGETVSFPLVDLANVYIDASVSAEGVNFLYVV